MNTQESRPAVLLYYAFALVLSAWLLTRDVPLHDATTQAAALAILASLLVNRRWLPED